MGVLLAASAPHCLLIQPGEQDQLPGRVPHARTFAVVVYERVIAYCRTKDITNHILTFSTQFVAMVPFCTGKAFIISSPPGAQSGLDFSSLIVATVTIFTHNILSVLFSAFSLAFILAPFLFETVSIFSPKYFVEVLSLHIMLY